MGQERQIHRMVFLLSAISTAYVWLNNDTRVKLIS